MLKDTLRAPRAPTCAPRAPTSMATLRKAEEICAQQKRRFTSLRRRVFMECCRYPGARRAYDILECLKEEGIAIKPPSLYRCLSFLLECGLIHRLYCLDAYIVCARPQRKHPSCFFLVCEQCRHVEECCADDLEEAVALNARRHSFFTGHTAMEIIGHCAQCDRAMRCRP